MAKARATTQTATADETSVSVRGQDLCRDLLGRRGYAETLFFTLTDKFPTGAELQVFEACLVALMEHGHNPTTIAARMTAFSNPEEIQVAVAAGLLNVGGVLLGTMDECGAILVAGAASQEPIEEFCRDIVADHRARRAPLPGFGHRTHRPEDPRAVRLMEIAADAGVRAQHVAALETLSSEADAAFGKHVPINATGAVAAILLDLGVPPRMLRGVAVVARAGGLLAHIVEEWRDRTALQLVDLAREAIPYRRPEAP